MANRFEKYVPDYLTRQEEIKRAGNRFAKYIPPQEPVEFSLRETISNIPSSALALGEDIYTAVRHPIDTATGIGKLAQSTGNKIGRNVAELVYGQEMEVMPQHSEQIADVVGSAIKDRYGSVDALKNTLMNWIRSRTNSGHSICSWAIPSTCFTIPTGNGR